MSCANKAFLQLHHEDTKTWNVSVKQSESDSDSITISVQIRAPVVKQPGCEPIADKNFYKIHSDKNNWRNALDICAEEEAHLLVINSEEEAEDVISLIEKHGTTRWVHWVGFHDHFQEGDYVTIFNEKLNSSGYQKWAPGEPGGSSSLNCGFFYYSNEYQFFPGLGYYRLHGMDSRKNWRDAQKVCEQEGSHLLVINSVKEEEVIRNLIEQGHTTGRLHWVGVHDQYREGRYVTVCNDSIKLAGYRRWYPGQPQGSRALNCLYYVFKNSSHRGLADGDCDWTGPFICEDESQGAKTAPVPTNGYRNVPGLSKSLYKVHNITRSWYNAVHECEKDGAHLVIINSEQEEQALMDIGGKGFQWVGIHDQYSEGDFITIFKSQRKTSRTRGVLRTVLE
ncbi:hypothetical protein C0J52_23765 [Blattella germanica]|nr:hypothetical protein C0J52_23765 [Blattella germanica]